MGREWKSKTFKSGNSLAMRLPKAMGFVEGDDVIVVPHSDGSFSFWKESDAKAVFMNLYGSVSKGFMTGGRGDIEQDDYDWESAPVQTKAA